MLEGFTESQSPSPSTGPDMELEPAVSIWSQRVIDETQSKIIVNEEPEVNQT